MNNFLKTALCTNKKLIETYAHADCAAFADVLHWNFKNMSFESKIIMAGSRMQNHFYVEVQHHSSQSLYCDAYGIFEDEHSILGRYGFTNEDSCEIKNYEEDKLFRTLVESSFLYESLDDDDSKEDIFFEEMLDVYSAWKGSLCVESV